ncbi:hypothetical protein QL285_060688 [Trifolium repens]|nr:hypothetical protein QL285_060688 [Trifolium repens]
MHVARTKILTATKLSAELITGLLSRKTDEAVLQNPSIDDKPATAARHDLLVLWRTPVIGWMKANTDGSVTNGSAVCGGLFRDYMGNFHGGYAQKIETVSVLHVELMTLIFAMELANSKGWKYLWLESDSQTALRAFDNVGLVPWDLRNRWSNCLHLGINLQWSHIYR